MFNFLSLPHEVRERLSRTLGIELKCSIAAAKAIADMMTLPIEKVDDPKSFYETTCTFVVRQKINNLNEVIVLDIKKVIEFVYLFWMLRYYTVYPNQNYLVSYENSESSVLGISAYAPETFFTLIRENSSYICDKVNLFKSVFNILNSQGSK